MRGCKLRVSLPAATTTQAGSVHCPWCSSAGHQCSSAMPLMPLTRLPAGGAHLVGVGLHVLQRLQYKETGGGHGEAGQSPTVRVN